MQRAERQNTLESGLTHPWVIYGVWRNSIPCPEDSFTPQLQGHLPVCHIKSHCFQEIHTHIQATVRTSGRVEYVAQMHASLRELLEKQWR